MQKNLVKKIKKIFKKSLTNQSKCAIIVSRGEGNSPNKEKRIKKMKKIWTIVMTISLAFTLWVGISFAEIAINNKMDYEWNFLNVIINASPLNNETIDIG